MTKDLVALGNRARSIAIIAVLVAGATIITGPAPARALARSFGAFALPEGMVARLTALASLSPRRRRRRRDEHPHRAQETVHTPPAQAPEPSPAQGPEEPPTRQETGSSPPRTGLQPGARVIGYVTAPEHAVTGDLSPTERTIEQACERAGWELVAIVRDPEGGRILDRPGLSHALELITTGCAKGLVVNDARLLSRSLDFAGLVNWFRDADAALIALDLGLDTSTPEGSRVASTLITLTGWAGERIAKRTSAASTAQPEVLERIAARHRDNVALQAIADELNAAGEPTPSGGAVWWPSTVQTALRYWRAEARAPMEDEVALERASG
jgi:DNA invertase Pin-like site-specific DNA recombinase